ncbi:hypothetical protein ACFXJJ_25160, partial [Streptomyces sp. NPDC059233]
PRCSDLLVDSSPHGTTDRPPAFRTNGGPAAGPPKDTALFLLANAAAAQSTGLALLRQVTGGPALGARAADRGAPAAVLAACGHPALRKALGVNSRAWAATSPPRVAVAHRIGATAARTGGRPGWCGPWSTAVP